ncbi:MAG: iron-containing redox enzyme family protein [Actinomycetota bacterium]|nr:iron-containing redox enzyme family protein [Actinomycetota bacterium]
MRRPGDDEGHQPEPSLPPPRGPSSAALIDALTNSPGTSAPLPLPEDGPLDGEDFHLSLYVCYELHYRGFHQVDPEWEWDPSLLRYRRELEAAFEAELRNMRPPIAIPETSPVPSALKQIVEYESGPSLSRFMEHRATLAQFREFVVHRSTYNLKEADPHCWAIPRLSGKPKAALVEVEADEYGGGIPERAHAHLFAESMASLGLDSRYGVYLDLVPGRTLATVNLMSWMGLHRRMRAGACGHLAAFEMLSSLPNRRYGNGLRRLGYGPEATRFFDEHVEADSVHEIVASHDLAGSLVEAEPHLRGDVLFGAWAYILLDAKMSAHILDSWTSGATSLRRVEVGERPSVASS